MEHFLLQLYTTLLEFSLPVKTIGFSFFLKILPDRSLHHCFHIAFNWITVEKKKKKQPYPYIELHMVHTPINCANHGVHRASDQRHSTSYFFSSWEYSSNSYIYAHKTVPLRHRILCLKLRCMMTSHRQIDKWRPKIMLETETQVFYESDFPAFLHLKPRAWFLLPIYPL